MSLRSCGIEGCNKTADPRSSEKIPLCTEHFEYILHHGNESASFRCSTCRSRTSARPLDPRFATKQCRLCFTGLVDEVLDLGDLIVRNLSGQWTSHDTWVKSVELRETSTWRKVYSWLWYISSDNVSHLKVIINDSETMTYDVDESESSIRAVQDWAEYLLLAYRDWYSDKNERPDLLFPKECPRCGTGTKVTVNPSEDIEHRRCDRCMMLWIRRL